MVLSIGTSYCDEDKPKRHAEWPSSSTGILQYRENMQRIAKDHVSNSLDGEQTWLNYLSVRNPDQSNKGRYIRLNLKLPRRPPKLDNVAEMRPLQELTERHFVDNPVIKQIACKLVASSFYFDSIGEVKETFDSDVYEVTGKLENRLELYCHSTNLEKVLSNVDSIRAPKLWSSASLSRRKLPQDMRPTS